MSSELAGAMASIERRIDALAAQLIVGPGDAGAEWFTSMTALLAAIAGEAAEDGLEETARIAAELQAGLEDSARSGAGAEALPALEQGLDRLRKATRPEEPAAAAQARPAAFSLGDDPDLLRDFVMESREHLASIEANLLVLERQPQETDAIHSVFRSFHTIKGLAGFLELGVVQEVSHEVETVLDLARNGNLAITPAVIDVVLAAADFLKQCLVLIEARLEGKPGDAIEAPAVLLGRIRALHRAGPSEPAKPAELAAPAAAEEPKERPAAKARNAGNEGQAVRVGTVKLDYLVDMVGEMMIAQSLVRHDPDLSQLNRPRLTRNLSQLARITQELQKTAMSMRMVQVSSLFQKMARLVRDLSRKSGKKVEFETSGEDTELDRHLVEELADPLMHMVRNSLDHGVETPEERQRAGKPPSGKVRLTACHQGGSIVIEIRDDGCGLDRTKILNKAVERGLVPRGAQLSDAEILNLIFQPGFSTAAQVTDISGRGVGMDVVRKQVAKLRGRVEIQSTPGQGTTFMLRLPLTLAIIDGLVVGVGKERYILPLFAVKEMMRPAPGMISTVEDRSEMALVRGRLLPVMRLSKRFQVKSPVTEAEEGVLIVAEASERNFCLLVDELIGKQEVVIKSLGEALNNIPGVAGGAILGDGRVGLILDLEGVFRQHAKEPSATT